MTCENGLEQAMFSSIFIKQDTTPNLPESLRRHNGQDIVKKGFAKRKRYLIAFSMKIQTLAGGQMGVLSDLDSPNPTIYMKLSDRHLHLTGRFLYPKTRYAVLKFGPKNIMCEDFFDCLIVFDKYRWIGPDEAPPPDIVTMLDAVVVPTATAEPSQVDGENGEDVLLSQGSQRQIGRRRKSMGRTPTESPVDSILSGQDSVRRSLPPRTARKRRKYEEYSSLSEEDDEDGSLDLTMDESDAET